MTTGEISRITGIHPSVISTHILKKWLPAERKGFGSRYHIEPADCMSWANWCYERGGITMHHPEFIRGHLTALYPEQMTQDARYDAI